MITALVLFALAVVIGFVGMLYEVATRRPGLALKSRAERENPMSAGCEMDAETLGLPAEHSADARPHFIGHGGGL